MVDKITVEVCVCTECIINGAMNIIDSVEGLRELEGELGAYDGMVDVNAGPCLYDKSHTGNAPVAIVNGEVLLKASQETVMAKIMELLEKNK